MIDVNTIEGRRNAGGLKFAIIASRFNDVVVEQLIESAVSFLIQRGAHKDDITLFRVPGAFEISQLANVLGKSEKYNGLICLGAVIRGATFHFEILARDVIMSLSNISARYNIPIGFGVLTTDTLEQALERAGGREENNKGAEAAAACLAMATLLEQIDDKRDIDNATTQQ